jgi:hypothetical protein
MWSLELHALVKREHYRDYLAEVEQDRLARMLRPVPLHHALARRLLYHVAHPMAMPLGRALLGLGLALLQWGSALTIFAATPPQPRRDLPAGTILGNGSRVLSCIDGVRSTRRSGRGRRSKPVCAAPVTEDLPAAGWSREVQPWSRYR